jgi:hypothetical protein
MIEYAQNCGHMKKRGLIFSEALFLMNRMPNLYGRPPEEMLKYRLGFVRKTGEDVKMYGRDKDDVPIVKLLGLTEFFSHDLVIIPWSQIPQDMDEPEVDLEIKPPPSDGDHKVDPDDQAD